mmetsp:Transcript_12614/g.39407  ORF Transcript_12614/g.39407 Transcript_12614/m.39407 type:complete len:752 (+) Transcript_12614:62-2317(+)
MLDSGQYEVVDVASDEDVWGLHWALLSGKQGATCKLTADRRAGSADGNATTAKDRVAAADATPAAGADVGSATRDASATPAESSALSPGGGASLTDGSSSSAKGGSFAGDRSTTSTDGSLPSSGSRTFSPAKCASEGDGGTANGDGSADTGDDGATSTQCKISSVGGSATASDGDAALAECKARATEGSVVSTDGSTVSARGTATSFDSSATSADGSANSADGRSKSDKARAGLKWSRQGTPSTELSREVTDNDECESSDADSRATRSTRTSLEDILDAPENEGAVYSRRLLLQYRPGGAPSPAARPPGQSIGPAPLRIAARPLTAKPPQPARHMERGYFVSPASVDESTAAVAASILQAELVLEALLTDQEPSGSTNSNNLLACAGPSGNRKPLTTMMLRNIPSRCTRLMLLKQLDHNGFQGEYDLVYVPVDRSNKGNSLGYAFINFRDATAASRFAARFHGAPAREIFPELLTGKILGVCYAEVQGREAYDNRRYNFYPFANPKPCGSSPRFAGCEEVDRASRPRIFFTAEGWAMREVWAPWPWMMHLNQRISISDSLPAGHSWAPMAFRAPMPLPRPGGGGHGKNMGRGMEASAGAGGAIRARGPASSKEANGDGGVVAYARRQHNLCPEAPEFVPTLASPESVTCAQPPELQVGMEAFELPAAAPTIYPPEPAAMRFPAHAEFVQPSMMGSSAWAVPGRGEMAPCNYWEPMENNTMSMGNGGGHAQGYEGHDTQMMYPWPYADFGPA